MNQFLRSSALLALVSFSGPAVAEPLHGTLCKDPNCPCCEGHAAYLREHGVEIDINPVDDHARISEQAGIPSDHEGCRTIFATE